MDKEKRLAEIIKLPRMWNGDIAQNGQFAEPLLELIKEYLNENSVVAEIGSYSGGSTELFALHCKTVYAIDCWADNNCPFQEQVENLKKSEIIFNEKMNKYSNVIKIRKLSSDACNDIPDGSLDCVYIDGDHRYKSVCEDIRNYFIKIKIGGIIAGHDYYDEIKLAVNDVICSPEKTYLDSSWVIKKGDKVCLK